MPRMDKLELQSIVSSNINSATGFLDSEVTQGREKALEYYRGDPFGDEREGHSQVVEKVVMDTVEWILPNLIRTFLGTRRVAEFTPHGPEDIDLSIQQTDYVNHIIREQNPGFMILYTWLKDGLIQKTGIVKHFWSKTTKTDTVEYEGLTEDELAFVIQEEEKRAEKVTVLEQSQEGRRGGFLPDPFTGQAVPFTQDTFSVKLRRIYKDKRVHIECIPPEEFLIERRAKSIHEADFTAHRTERMVSDLIAEGFDRNLVESLPSSGHDDMTGEKETRYEDEDDLTPIDTDSTRKVDITECYIRVDFDGDGIAELRQVIVGGQSTILSNEEIDEIPFSAWTPIPMPHRSEVAGMSAADAIMDLQRIKSTLLRQMLDNLYLTNNPQMEVVWDQVEQKDALTNRPGGIKRVNQPGMYNPLNVPFVAGQSFPMLEYLEQKQAGRTGVSPTSTGLDPDILKSHQTAGAIDQVMTTAQQKIDLIARVFAETGLKNLMKQVLKLTTKHQDKEAVIRLKGKWVPVDPR
ncbi:MAG: portal protein, partial [Geminicoccaceae bacterium]